MCFLLAVNVVDETAESVREISVLHPCDRPVQGELHLHAHLYPVL
jgi:hypothetical protein